MIELSLLIVPALFLLFIVWLFVEQFSGSLEELGYRVPRWLRAVLIILIMVGFAAAYALPGKSANAFQLH